MAALRPTPKILTLAYDIERTGAPDGCRVIAIGASVIDETFTERDTFLAACFKPNEALFEWRCVHEFWLGTQLQELAQRRSNAEIAAGTNASDTPMHILEKLAALSPGNTQDEAERIAIDGFVAFCIKWETKAREENATLMRCSDNAPFDTTWINKLLAKYRPDILPLPYEFSTGKYARHYDVHQMQLGFLGRQNAELITKYWGCGNAIEALWEVPPKTKQHTHMPDEDAYTIAFDLQVVVAAARGTLAERNDVE
jgi:hypothetical protein